MQKIRKLERRNSGPRRQIHLHRAVMLGSLAKGTTRITGFLQGADCLSTISCFEKMGVSIENTGDTVLVHGRGMRGLEKPEGVLDCGNSGTTMRLISGILSAQDFDVTLTGDASIQKRPMKRIMDPLSRMGADIESLPGMDAPLCIFRAARSPASTMPPLWPLHR